MVDGVIRARGVRCRVAESFDDVVECGVLKNAVGGDLITITTPKLRRRCVSFSMATASLPS